MEFKSFIKKVKPVSPYKNSNLSLKDRFLTPERKGFKWRNELENWKKEKEPMATFHWFTKGYAFTRIEPWREELHSFVQMFTLKEISDKKFDTLTRLFLPHRKKYIKSIRRNKRDELEITLKNNEKMKFTTLTSYYPRLDTFMPELRTHDRDRKCHDLSRKLAIQHYVDDVDAHVVTGVVNRMSPKYKYLHSWVEVERNGKTLVLDPVENIVTDKKTYDKYFDVKEFERISGEDLFRERDVWVDLVAVDGMYSKLYLSSHDEALDVWREFGFDKMTKDERIKTRQEYYNSQKVDFRIDESIR